MTDRELLYIKTIAEERNISVAAKKLFMTQPALSHCLLNLEAEIGTPLFVRTANGLDMTYAGECYYEMATDILDIYNDYQQKLVDISEMRKGRVRIGMTRYLSRMLLHRVLPEFSGMYPNVEIRVEEKSSEELEKDVIARKIDFAVLHDFDVEGKKKASNVKYQTLSRDDFCIVTKKDTDLVKKASRLTGYPYPVLDPRHLEQLPFVLETPSHRMRAVVNDILRRVNIEPRISLETELFETAYNLAEVGYGVTIVNERYVREFADISRVSVFSIPKKYKPYWTLYLICHVNGYMPLATQQLLQIILRKESVNTHSGV